MLSTCFFPTATSVLEEADETSHGDETKFDAMSPGNGEIDKTYDDDDVAHDLREDESVRDDAEKSSAAAGNCIIGDFTLLRDFFLAAFSDGYYKVSCCGSEGLFPGGGCFVQPSSSNRDISHNVSSGSGKGSYDTSVSGPHRKRPLAVAVGFKYAEDMNGRPIVITPGCRRMPVFNRKSSVRHSPPSSPASRPILTKKLDVASLNMRIPTDLRADTRQSDSVALDT